MKKQELISKIIELNSELIVSDRMNWFPDKNYGKYVNSSIYYERSGGGRIKHGSCTWNRIALNKSTKSELEELYKDVERTENSIKIMYERYSKPMSIFEFFNLFKAL